MHRKDVKTAQHPRRDAAPFIKELQNFLKIMNHRKRRVRHPWAKRRRDG